MLSKVISYCSMRWSWEEPLYFLEHSGFLGCSRDLGVDLCMSTFIVVCFSFICKSTSKCAVGYRIFSRYILGRKCDFSLSLVHLNPTVLRVIFPPYAGGCSLLQELGMAGCQLCIIADHLAVQGHPLLLYGGNWCTSCNMPTQSVSSILNVVLQPVFPAHQALFPLTLCVLFNFQIYLFTYFFISIFNCSDTYR